jgi:hypothetical protein
MNSKAYALVTGVVFFVLFCGNLLQFFSGFPVALGGVAMPMWTAWLSAVVFGFLGFEGFKLGGFFEKK